MTLNELATKQMVDAAEERLTKLLLKRFQEVLNEVRSQNNGQVNEKYLTVKELMEFRKIKSRTTIDKYIKKGILKYEDWGNGEKRSLRFPISQFKSWILIETRDVPHNMTG
ncbi:MAG: helix-turn-helix domain-containing protein [Bacteroidetes bacterium]|nr:helix-turn-helix domain-containing protein [Bacteroidota bacterium]